ncbi:MAG TPA: DUF2868 domain-containing protein [Sphingomonadaceae bacterium]|nr:DUF2868 domain-containing protein [Sphingomonadaceae bacterium]
MREEDALSFLLVRAVELEDGAEAVLTRDDRREATTNALGRGHGDSAGFLARRAEFLHERLLARFPAVRRVTAAARWPQWVSWALPLAALALGVVSNELGGGKQLNIIAFPLLGMLVWNLFAYALLLGRTLVRRPSVDRPGGNGLARLIGRLTEPAIRRLDAQPVVGRAIRRFAGDWLSASSALSYSRASRTLHLSAAALALGALLGMYGRALGIEYRAGWESTFIGAETLRGGLTSLLGPASLLTGIAVPDLAGIRAMRWSVGPGVDAAPWIHLFAATALLFIIGPRLALAAWHAARAGRLGRRLPVGQPDDGYARRLLRSARGESVSVRVVPYSYRLPDRSGERLADTLKQVLGAGTQVNVDSPVAYGAEDEWLAGAAAPAAAEDHVIVLFNLAATPEAENQGAFIGGLRRIVEPRGGQLSVILNEATFRQRLSGQGADEARLQARRSAWSGVGAPHGVAFIGLDLEEDEPGELVRRLEEGLLRSPTKGADRP